MSKKSLLEEGTVRRFMKLAGTQVLASDFLTETKKGEKIKTGKTKGEEAYEDPSEGEETKSGEEAYTTKKGGKLKHTEDGGARGDEKGDKAFVNEQTLTEQDEELEFEAEEEDVGGEEVEDLELDLEEPGAELAMDDEEVEEEPEPEAEELVRRMVDAIAGVAEEFGVDVDVSEEEAPELEVPDMDVEEEEDITGELGPDGVDVEETEETEMAELDEINYIDEDLVLNEVFHRVKKRLLREKRIDEMSSRLAKRISGRLNKRTR